MSTWSTDLPALLAALHELDFYIEDGEEIDFEPYQSFFPSEENASWFKVWTGNASVDGAQFRVFGQDGTGGYAALWLIHPEKALEEQPVVFLGSEGERGVIAVNLDEYLWLLAAGIGPYETVAYPDLPRKPKPHFAEFARKNSRVPMLSVEEVIARAGAAYPSFSEYIDELCR
ncbi:hypothetical protein [Undibacterium rugosum]|uniref:hypothetical protein n=1 Tax=Undibacterium rugosum TaxID=2762291 RepID=UPI001B83AEC9|nr:hypothetical protein [Undibacterium rugosum]MBR7780421.1 hypothetical protein [Undibacterium rugosum]